MAADVQTDTLSGFTATNAGKRLKNFIFTMTWSFAGTVCWRQSPLWADGMKRMKIKIKYFDKESEKIRNIEGKSDWYDLRAAETVHLKKGEYRLIPLGVGVILPEGYEANIVPRSSTFKNWGILQTNSFGVIDNSYSGDNDQWMFPAYATRDTVINKNDRICQFRINKKQPELIFEEVDHLNDADRGGFGSTGV